MPEAATAGRTPATVWLVHEGRKSGKPYRTRIWFAVVGGRVWIGSLDRDRSWVKNVRAAGKAKLDFGSGPIDVTCRYTQDPRDLADYRAAITRKHPIAARLIRPFVRGKPCAFVTDLRWPPEQRA